MGPTDVYRMSFYYLTVKHEDYRYVVLIFFFFATTEYFTKCHKTTTFSHIAVISAFFFFAQNMHVQYQIVDDGIIN